MRKETVQEYLARGGKITTLPAKEREQPVQAMNPTTAGPANLLTYGEADLYYGEAKARKAKKEKIVPKIDISALPPALRQKYLERLNANDEED